MSYKDRLAKPFSGDWARAAYSTSAYLQSSYSSGFDPVTGNIDIQYEPDHTQYAIGDPGTILTDKRLFIPNFELTPKNLVNLGFMMGYLNGVHQGRKSG